jgi:hypothetical protein
VKLLLSDMPATTAIPLEEGPLLAMAIATSALRSSTSCEAFCPVEWEIQVMQKTLHKPGKSGLWSPHEWKDM